MGSHLSPLWYPKGDGRFPIWFGSLFERKVQGPQHSRPRRTRILATYSIQPGYQTILPLPEWALENIFVNICIKTTSSTYIYPFAQTKFVWNLFIFILSATKSISLTPPSEPFPPVALSFEI
jgi:hypothetical protein